MRNILSLLDLEPAAQRHLPRPIYGYVSGGVEDNVTLRANRSSFSDWSFCPKVLVDVSRRSQAKVLMGTSYACPFGIAPMGLAALAAYDGDCAMARAAEASGIPFVLSGSSLTGMECVAKAAPQCSWFQAYLPGEREKLAPFVSRIANAGFRTLMVTVDTPTAGNRENNLRVGFTTPLRPSPRLAWDGIVRPRWLVGTLARTLATHGMLYFENADAGRGVPVISRNVVRQFGMRDHLNWQHLAEVRELWKGRLVVKGVARAEDVARCAQFGVDGVVISNHGGRQLDSAAPALALLPQAVSVKGDMVIMLDSGVRRGTDVLKALCLGADFVFVGRPMLYAAALGGEAGVRKAIDLMCAEVLRGMAMLGVNDLGELGRDFLQRSTDPAGA